MRHLLKVVVAVVVLVVGAPRAQGQEAGDSVGQRAIRWLGASQSTRAHNHRGVDWDKKGEFDKAIAEFTEAIRLDPSNTRAYYNRGVAWKKKGEFDKAIADYTEAIRLDPKAFRAFDGRASVWILKHEYDKAIADYNALIRIDPEEFRAFNDRAYVWKLKHEYDKAIADLNEAIRLNPGEAWVYSNRGFTWAENGEYARAIADYTAAIRIDPEEAMAYNRRAWLWATCSDARYRDGKQAVASATRACELTGHNDAGFLDTLAAACAEAVDFDAAMKWQERVLEITKDEKAREPGRARLALYRAKKPYRDDRVAR